MTPALSEKMPVPVMWTGILGALPLWLGTILLWSRTDPVNPASAISLVLSYGALVLCFLGGIRWGVAIGPYDAPTQVRQFMLSLLPFAAALLALFLPPVVGVSLLISGFLVSAFWDMMAMHHGRLPVWFARFRMMLTAMMVPALLFAMGRLIYLV